MLVVTKRAITMQNSTCSSTAISAMSTPDRPRANPITTPSRPITLAAGQAPVAEAASSPMASGRVRSGYRAIVAGSRVLSRPKASNGRISQPKAKTVNITEVRTTAVLWPCNEASSANMPSAVSTAKAVLVMNEALARLDDRSALASRRSFSRTRSRAMTIPPHWPWRRPGR